MDGKKQIIIIDDHPMFREGIKSVIQSDDKYEVVGEAGSAAQGLKLIKKFKVDLAVVDISLPDLSGFELIQSIHRYSTDIRTIVVSMHSKVDYVVKAFQAGALGYLTKDAAVERLIKGIEHTLRGEYFLDSSVSEQVIKKLLQRPDNKKAPVSQGYDALTTREQEIMVLVTNGMSSKEIADRLYISPKTVENHRSKIMRKLNVNNVIDLVKHAAKIGLVDLDLWKE
ncbi:two component transcriptional regulator, LuxR family [Desulfocicer vacuolatum DSM 3385]|uniref:Two component transcriptional regulator, LuxR family n=1 Tax=Desulfocicer vacuolatum DSM 3385 TaxID=1121400 RepID=A0A1W2EFF2_9BACT|nr:response regulator transcription factor [Desulfocicer vacuolatum]SMD08385.1 two component transcriptional regulator, LuxR family [Desulfocicer vacuolatum DSM 3385]